MLKAGQEEAETTTAIIRKPGSVGTSGEAEADDVNGLRHRSGKSSVKTRKLLAKPLITHSERLLENQGLFSIFLISHACSSLAEPPWNPAGRVLGTR